MKRRSTKNTRRRTLSSRICSFYPNRSYNKHRKAELQKLTEERDEVKRDNKLLEKQISELQDVITAARKKQPRQGKKKGTGEKASSLVEPILEQATYPEDVTEMKNSFVKKEKHCCCYVI